MIIIMEINSKDPNGALGNNQTDRETTHFCVGFSKPHREIPKQNREDTHFPVCQLKHTFTLTKHKGKLQHMELPPFFYGETYVYIFCMIA
jgi:hypothetical protein